MSLRLSIIDALYAALDNGYEDEITNMTPRQIADDMLGHEIFTNEEFERAVAVLNDLRAKGDI